MKCFFRFKFWPALLNRRGRLILAPILLIGGSFFCAHFSWAATESVNGNINVQMSTPSSICGNGTVQGSEQCDDGNIVNGDGCSSSCQIEAGPSFPPPPPPPTDFPPTVSNVTVVTTTTSTAKITWQASDDHGIGAVVFVYGKTASYGSSTIVGGSYEVNLSGLDSNTVYYFKISVTDTKPQTTDYTGSFQTLNPPPPPPDVTPPTISNVVITAGAASAVVSWDTNEIANSQINYGFTTEYGLVYTDANRVLNHTGTLLNLLANTTYHLKIFSTDAAGNSTSTGDYNFLTQKDNVAPPDVSGLALSTTTNSIILNWSNPSLVAVPDFSGVKVLRKVGSPSASSTDGVLVYTGAGQGLVDSNVLPNTNYYYTVFSFDTSGNYSAGIFVNGQIVSPPAPQEICGNGFDDDNNGQIDCADDVCRNLPACQTPVEVCNNGLDDDHDGSADCLDTECALDPSCRPIRTEVCDNGMDDDGDGLVDCVDPDCSAALNCSHITGGIEICNNNIDDDTDGLTDCADSDCAGFSGCQAATIPVVPAGPGSVPPAGVPTSSVPVFEEINYDGLLFLAGNRQIRLTSVNGKVTSLASSNFSVGVPKKILAGVPQSITFVVDDADQHQMNFDSAADAYFSDIIFPRIGEHRAYVRVDYGLGQVDVVEFYLESLPWGEVRDDSGNFVPDAKIMLFGDNGREMDLGFYGERNPLFSDINGAYGWMVPVGRYYVTVGKVGYYERSTPVFLAGNNIVNINFTLIVRPLDLADVIDPNATIGENAQNLAKNLLSKAKVGVSFSAQGAADVVNTVGESAKDPVVQEIASSVVAPTTVAVATAGTVFLISWANVWPLLQFLFFQPLMLLGRRKREKWGEVYHSLSKLPVDLAVVRLLDADTGKIVQSKVTDSQGRYVFLVNPGKYLLSATKSGMIFPSALLKEFKDDGRRADIYHGEIINVSERDTTITANIPLDPAGAVKPPWRLRLEKFGRSVQYALSWTGLAVTAGTLYISPHWYVWVLLGVHLVSFFLFRRLAMPARPKGWGIVYDKQDRKPIARVVARLFDSQFNKLVGTEITDAKGRYAFLAGESRYYIAYEHTGYQESKTGIIDLSGKKSSTITVDVALQRKGESDVKNPIVSV